MCYTIKIDLTREELEKRFGAKLSNPDDYKTGTRISAFSLPLLPVICNDNPEEIRLFNWGLIPHWIKDAEKASEIRVKTFNARSETIDEKPSFRHVFGQKRCLVLVSGFYEWQTMEKEKIPYYIGLKQVNAFALAGLYDQWINPGTGDAISTFTVVTTKANPMMEEIHNIKKRMPVILAGKDEKTWLDAKADSRSIGLFDPFPDNLMFAEKLK